MKLNNETIREAVKLWIEDEAAATKKYGFINDWDTSEVTDMSKLFYTAENFNSPIGNWNVSNVSTMRGMFSGAKSFNQPIGDWDVSNVTNMEMMFFQAEAYQYPKPEKEPIKKKNPIIKLFDLFKPKRELISKFDNKTIRKAVKVWCKSETKAKRKYVDMKYWDTSEVTDMSYLFSSLRSFNQPIGDWDVSNVTNMEHMFWDASSFNQPIGDWDVSKVTNMSHMFSSAYSFNQPIGNWDVSNVTDMRQMFSRASSFNQPIGDWDVSNVTDMSYMFYKAYVFNQDINNWDVSNVATMRAMFSSADSFNQPIGDWDVSNVTNMSYMFSAAKSFNQPIGKWDVLNVEDMLFIFSYAESFNQPIENWDVSNVKDMEDMFDGANAYQHSKPGIAKNVASPSQNDTELESINEEEEEIAVFEFQLLEADVRGKGSDKATPIPLVFHLRIRWLYDIDGFLLGYECSEILSKKYNIPSELLFTNYEYKKDKFEYRVITDIADWDPIDAPIQSYNEFKVPANKESIMEVLEGFKTVSFNKLKNRENKDLSRTTPEDFEE